MNLPASPPTSPAPAERHRLHPAVIVVFALAATMVLTVVLGLWHVRRDTLDAQSRLLASIATATADELQRGLQGVMRGMQALRDDLREGHLRPGQPHTNEQLQRQLATLALVRKLWVVDLQGQVLAASSPAARAGVPGFGPDTASQGDEQLALGTPVLDLVSHDTVVTLALRFARPDGRIGGWVMAELPANVLLGSFPRATPAPDARMAVLRSDGALLAGTLAQQAGAPQPRPLRQGAEALRAFDDGTWRLLQQRRIEPLGLQLVVTRDIEASLARWYDALRIAVLATAATLSVLGAMLWRMLRAERARFRVQGMLQAERDRASLAFAAAKEGNWDWDPATALFYASPRMKELMGLPRAGRPGAHSVADLAAQLHPDDVPLLERMLAQQAGAPVQALGQAPLDLIVRTRQGADRWRSVRLRGTAALDEAGRAIRLAGVAGDVTEELARAEHTRRLEVRLARAQRLESLGTLAGTVAHDFNNILAAVLGYSEMARQAAPEGSAQARHLDQVLQAAQRGRGVIERILTFGRGGARRHEVFAVQPVVEQVLGLLAATIDSRIRIERDLAQPALCVRGDATALFEAVMNLFTNAVQALEARAASGTGVLGVSLQEAQFCQEHWTSHGRLAPGPYVRLVIRDNGAGMDAEALEHLFEPFFTTRGAAGTGLGLAVVHGVAEVFGGGVDVQSLAGEGSTFTLYLPQAAGAGASAAALPGTHCSDAPQGEGQTVLVVDDEAALVGMAEEVLAALGYEPVGLTDPAAALAELQADPQRFDLLLTDEVMPGMPGTDLARRARALCPGLPVLLVSGYGGPQLAQRARDVGIARVLTKPLRLEDLARAVADVLGERQAARPFMPTTGD